METQPLRTDRYSKTNPNSNEKYPSFTEADVNGDGVIELEELQKIYPNLPKDQLEDDFRKFDKNKDGVLDRREYMSMMRRRMYNFAQKIVLPKNQRLDEVDGQYEEQYTCCPPPVFILTITLIEIGIFAYHTNDLINKEGWVVGINGPAPIDSVLIYSPYRRYEAWRFLTYMLVHSGWMHIVNNAIMQLFLGILLEMVHSWWRVLLVYFAGVLAGSLTTSITDPNYYLAGASGGVYALITAHVATVILNWKDMELPWVRVICFVLFCIVDVGTALYYRHISKVDNKVGYAAHFGGALLGLLIGIFVLKNFQWQRWERVLWWVCLFICIGLTTFAVLWNILNPDHFPPSQYGKKEKLPSFNTPS